MKCVKNKVWAEIEGYLCFKVLMITISEEGLKSMTPDWNRIRISTTIKDQIFENLNEIC